MQWRRILQGKEDDDAEMILAKKKFAHSFSISTLCRLATNYFNGLYHLEAIMYRESISRTELCHLIDRFRDKLYVIKHEEPFISYWVSSDRWKEMICQ